MKHSIRYFFWMACLALSLVMPVRFTDAQEPAAETKPKAPDRVPEALEQLFKGINEESLREKPKRDYEVLKGPLQKPRLFRADPRLLENKFVATIVLLPARLDLNDAKSIAEYQDLAQEESGWLRTYPEDLRPVIEMDNHFLFHTGSVRSARAFGGGRSRVERVLGLSEHHKLLVERCPTDQRPDQRLISFLTSSDCDRDTVRSANDLPGTPNEFAEWTYLVYAPTADEAQQRAEAILRLFDCGLSRPTQQYLLAEGRKSLDAARKGYEELAKQDEAIRAEDEKLAKPTEITPDILRELKAQKVMVAVELAGLNARVNACNAMLKDDERVIVPHIRESINDIKVKAEIELAGIKEKLDRINTFIAEANNYYALQSRIIQMKHTQQILRSQIKQDERRAESFAHLVSLYAPLQLKNNQITISPVEWTN